MKDLNFVGGMIHGLTNSKFDDGKESWPVYETAAKLDVPIYLHPGMPHHEVRKPTIRTTQKSLLCSSKLHGDIL